MKHTVKTGLLILLLLTLVGCESSDQRLADYARQHVEQQAKQNITTSELARETSDNQRRMVESVEKSRQDLVGLQKGLEQQRGQIAEERRELSERQHWESLLAPVLTSIGYLLITSLPLILCWYLLHTVRNSPADEAAVTQLLVQDLISETPVLLPAPSQPVRRLTLHAGDAPATDEHSTTQEEGDPS